LIIFLKTTKEQGATQIQNQLVNSIPSKERMVVKTMNPSDYHNEKGRTDFFEKMNVSFFHTTRDFKEFKKKR
jgi:hypothetical protein